MGALLSAPPDPPAPPEAPDYEGIRKDQRKKAAERAQRSGGRSSTVLTDRKLGG